MDTAKESEHIWLLLIHQLGCVVLQQAAAKRSGTWTPDEGQQAQRLRDAIGRIGVALSPTAPGETLNHPVSDSDVELIRECAAGVLGRLAASRRTMEEYFDIMGAETPGGRQIVVNQQLSGFGTAPEDVLTAYSTLLVGKIVPHLLEQMDAAVSGQDN